MIKNIFIFFVFILLFSINENEANALVAYVEGTVYYQGSPVNAATVQLYDSGNNLVSQTSTNSYGMYAIPLAGLSSGNYKVKGSKTIHGQYYSGNNYFYYDGGGDMENINITLVATDQ